MTVSGSTNRISYSGDGATVAFAVAFYFQSAADLKVYIVDSDGEETLQTLTTEYSVSGTAVNGVYPFGGTVTMVSAPAADEELVIIADPEVDQGLDLTNDDSFDAEAVEQALDKQVMILRRFAERLDRILELGETDTDGSGAYDVNGNRIENLGTPAAASDAATKDYIDSLVAGGVDPDILPVANQAEAEAGTANDKAMTPLRVTQFWDVQTVGTTMLESAAVTAAKAAVASQAEAEAGSDATKLMTPERTAQAVAALAPGGVIKAARAITSTTTYGSGAAVTPHADATKALIFITGGGGAGSDGAGSNQHSGPGGGAGGTAIKLVDLASDIGSSKTVTIGAGGTTTSAAGGNSSIDTATPIQGNGGTGGTAATGGSVPGGAGGTASGGDMNPPGGSGGGNANVGTGVGAAGGHGGGSLWGGGGGGGSAASFAPTAGLAATAYGGGGGGGGCFEGTASGHGDGAAGVCFILEF